MHLILSKSRASFLVGLLISASILEAGDPPKSHANDNGPISNKPIIREASGNEELRWAEPSKMAKIRDRIHESLRNEALARNNEQRSALIVSLCDWYAFIRSHREFDDFTLMQSEASKIRNRLIRSRRRWINQLKRSGEARPAKLSGQIDSEIEHAIAEVNRSQGDQPHEVHWNGDHWNGAAAGAGLDNGWGLVELITRTIAPEAWASNGGTATVRYFATRRVLVVSATTEVHEELEALLRALR